MLSVIQRPLGHGNHRWNRANNPQEPKAQRKMPTKKAQPRVRKNRSAKAYFQKGFPKFSGISKKISKFPKFSEISKTFTRSTKSTPNPGNEGPFWNFLEVFGNRLFFGRQPRQGRPTEGATKSLFSRGFPKFPAMKIF